MNTLNFRSAVAAWCLAGLGASGVAWADTGPMDFLFNGSAPPLSESPRSAPRIWKVSEYSAVRLAAREPGANANQHPMVLDASAMQRLLADVQVTLEGGKTRRLFDPAELTDLAPYLVRAFAAASADDDVLLMSSARRESGFLSMPSTLTARLFAADNALQLIVYDARAELVGEFRIGGQIPKVVFGSRLTPSKALLSASNARVRRPDWLAVPFTVAAAAPVVVEPIRVQVPAAAPVTPATPAPAVAPVAVPAKPVAQEPAVDDGPYAEQARKLNGLKKLRDQGLITEQEYQQKRQEVIKSL